jgi:1-acyl-sn-glycerol-3-phosphate acyltransferase
MIRSTVFNLYFYLLTLLAALLGLVLAAIPSPAPLRALLHGWARVVRWGMRWIGGMQVEVRGRQYLSKQGPALFAGKHQCEIDAILLAADVPDIAFVAMQELFRLPVIGTVLRRLQMIEAGTGGGEKARAHFLRSARRASEGGRPIVIYPEGYLMSPGERERYRSGIYYLYRDLGLPVTPVATSVGLLWNRRSWRKHTGRAAFELLPPIETGLDKETFMRRLEQETEQASDRLIAEFSGRPYAPSRLVLRSQGQMTAAPTDSSTTFA